MSRFIVAASSIICFLGQAIAQVGPLSESDEKAFRGETDLWLDVVFGHCMSKVAGETWGDRPASLRGQWNDLRSDYASTLQKPLIDPKVSAAPSAIILDLTLDGSSCWTQLTDLAPDYTEAEFSTITDRLIEEDRVKTAFVDQGNGPQQVGVLLVGRDRVPVIFYQVAGTQAGVRTIVTIVQRTVPGFVYVD